MKEGQPFLTKELDEIRARQREALRRVEDWIFRDFQPGGARVDTEALDIDGLLVESELRRRADEMSQKIRPILEKMASAQGSIELRAFVQKRIEAQDVRINSAYFFEVLTELDTTYNQNRMGQHPDGKERVILTRYITYLVWADELAGDGYTDPRIQQASS